MWQIMVFVYNLILIYTSFCITFYYNLLNSVVFLKFRKDVNGLRAIAVIAVMLFHFNASWMPGRFAGVDIFFVI